MRVLMFGWEFPPHNSGGLGMACFGLSQALTWGGVNVTFVLPRAVSVAAPYMDLVFADNSTRLSVRQLDSLLMPYMTSDQYATIRDKVGGPYGASLFDEVARYADLAEHVARDRNFDVIHAHDWLSFGAGANAKRVSGKPFIAHVHATEFDRAGGENVNSHVYRIEREGFRAADKIIAVSHYTKKIVAEKYGINPDKIHVVHNGVLHEDLRERTAVNRLRSFKALGYKVVLYLGRLTIQKGPDYFLKAAARVLKENQHVVFLVAGSGDMERQLIMEASYLGISDKVFFTGFLRGTDQRDAYEAADLYVLPSVSEPFGLTPLEALYAGTPVLISKQSGVSEVLSHALKVDFWDIDEMAGKMLAVLEHTSLHETLRENGRREALAQTWRRAADRCVELYQLLMRAPA